MTVFVWLKLYPTRWNSSKQYGITTKSRSFRIKHHLGGQTAADVPSQVHHVDQPESTMKSWRSNQLYSYSHIFMMQSRAKSHHSLFRLKISIFLINKVLQHGAIHMTTYTAVWLHSGEYTTLGNMSNYQDDDSDEA